MKCNKTIFYIISSTNIILITWLLWVQSDIMYSILLLLWINMMFYSINRLYQRIILLCFGISFFTFLMGRDGLEYLFGHERETIFTSDTNNHAYLCMILALLGVWITYVICNKKIKRVSAISLPQQLYNFYIRKYSKICFYLTYPFALLVNLAVAYFVIRYGYAAKFTDLRALVEASPIYYTFTKIELLLPVSFSIFVATLPSKSEFNKLAKFYLIYLVITLTSGGRAGFILGILLLIIFIAYLQYLNPNIVWINKKKIKLIIIFLPLIAIGGSLINTVRFGETTEKFSIINSFTDFFYDQGVTSNAVKRAYELEDEIPVQSGFYTFEFLHSGIIARICGYKVYQGNTIEHATKGGSFTHALGYTIMGGAYLSGRGPGTSYVAELYYDFGYFGVFLGSCIYGFILAKLSCLKNNNVFKRSVIFISITNILWAPRGAFSGFLSLLFAPTTIGLLMFVFMTAQMLYVKYKKKNSLKICHK